MKPMKETVSIDLSKVRSIECGGKENGSKLSKRGQVAARRMLSLHNPFDKNQKLW